mmetsp:Transcript_29997/g.49799  ORF Transcript_29997/g.49799 Transcript_29997/m.49799 type:complete len:503 (+) Transcript_29997:295-1803(+)
MLFFSNNWSPLVIATVCTALLGVVAQSVAGQDACTLSDPLFLDANGALTLQQVKNTNEGTFTMRIKYTGGHAWIGIGVNLDGRPKMTPVQSVIGRLEPSGSSTSVWKYRLASDDTDASGVVRLNDDLQSDLQSATFVQDFDETTQEEISILEFTHPLQDNAGAMSVTDNSVWVFAVGNADNAWTGKHKISGSFQLPLTDNCVSQGGSNNAGTDSSTGTDTGSTTGGNTGGGTNTGTGGVVVVGGGDSEDESDDESYEYSSYAESEDEDGSANSISSNGFVVIDAQNESEKLFLAHGICMAIAWGIFAPLAIGASFARKLSCLDRNANWLKFHLWANVLVVLLTTVGFALAVAAVNKDGEEEHFTENSHTKAGLVVFLFVIVQAITGYFRPAAAKPKPASTETEKDNNTAGDGSDLAGVEEQAPPKLEKTNIRFAWEIGHRMLALIILGLAWYNCTTGIELQIEDFGNGNEEAALRLWMGVFWGVTATLSGAFLVMGIVQRMQ